MGKKPLAGLLGLVAAVTLVTAGCECCGRSCQRNNNNTTTGKYKPTPAFQPGKTDMTQTPAPGGANEKDLAPPPPRPADPTNTPAPGGSPQAFSAGTPSAISGLPVSSLRPQQSAGWDNRAAGAAAGPGMPSFPAPPTTPARSMGADMPPLGTPPPPGSTQPLPPIPPDPAVSMAAPAPAGPPPPPTGAMKGPY